MTTYISILRGINVSGHRLIKMPALKELLTGLGFSAVQTYIQSGNVVFQYGPSDTQAVSEAIQSGIEQQFGFDVPVITLTLDELEKVIAGNPFVQDASKDPAFFHVTFLAGAPAGEYFEKIKAENYGDDAIELLDKALYLYCPNSYSNSKLTNSFLESRLKVPATTRNWKTANELLKMARQINPAG